MPVLLSDIIAKLSDSCTSMLYAILRKRRQRIAFVLLQNVIFNKASLREVRSFLLFKFRGRLDYEFKIVIKNEINLD